MVTGARAAEHTRDEAARGTRYRSALGTWGNAAGKAGAIGSRPGFGGEPVQHLACDALAVHAIGTTA